MRWVAGVDLRVSRDWLWTNGEAGIGLTITGRQHPRRALSGNATAVRGRAHADAGQRPAHQPPQMDDMGSLQRLLRNAKGDQA